MLESLLRSSSLFLVVLTPPSAPAGGPNSAVRVNSHGAKIKPATVKWPRPCHSPNAVAVLNGDCDLLAVGEWTGAADFAHWESNKNHWAYYGLGCYQWLYAAARQGFGVFFFPRCLMGV